MKACFQKKKKNSFERGGAVCRWRWQCFRHRINARKKKHTRLRGAQTLHARAHKQTVVLHFLGGRPARQFQHGQRALGRNAEHYILLDSECERVSA
jgi:hypothetical protein